MLTGEHDMGALKEMLFEVLSQTLSVEEFADWLYHDEFIQSEIVSNEMILELACFDFKAKVVLHNLGRFCFQHFDREEFLIALIEKNYHQYSDTQSAPAAELMLNRILQYHAYGEEYLLLDQFAYLRDDLSLAREGFLRMSDFRDSFDEFARVIFRALQGKDLKQQRFILKAGIDSSLRS